MHPWLHFKTITRHKLLVMHYCFRAGMYKQGLLHDLSKYAPVEFLVGCKYYQGDRSPNNAEREDTGISKSWLHHKGVRPACGCGTVLQCPAVLHPWKGHADPHPTGSGYQAHAGRSACRANGRTLLCAQCLPLPVCDRFPL